MSTGPISGAPERVVLVANARMPSERAQSVQLARASLGFVEAGSAVSLLHARRRGTPTLAVSETFARLIARPVAPEALPELVSVRCIDTIDTVPRALQFMPARVQEWTFGRSAARVVKERFKGDLVIARDIEVAARLCGRPRTAWEVHRVPGGRMRRRLVARIQRAGMRCIAISGGVADDLVQLGMSREAILIEHDAYDPRSQECMPTRDEARAALGLVAGARVVLYFGGLLRWKGVDVLVDAVRDGHIGDATVIIVGGMSKDVDDLREYASGLPEVSENGTSLRIEGFKPARDVSTYLAAADVAVVPNRRSPRISSHYTSPLKVFEALGAGVPLVVSDLPSLRDAVASGAAVFVEPENPAALGQGIERILSDATLRTDLIARGRVRVKDATWERRAQRISSWIDASAATRHASTQ